MPSGTKIRTLARLLDASESAVWVISPQGKLIYLSAGVTKWLGVDADALVNRLSVAGAAISDDPMDFVAASLSPPPGFAQRGTANMRVQPPPIDGRKIEAIDVHFVRLGEAGDAATIAIAGKFPDGQLSEEIRDARTIRRQLDAWRSRHATVATMATAGVSPAAKRLRTRLHVAASTRTHIGFFGPAGSGAESIAQHIHQRSTKDEPITVVDGPLMDAELLDATMSPLINHLATAQNALGSVLVRGLDEMPIEASQRLAELLTTFGGRLRLLGLCGPSPDILSEPLDESTEITATLDENESSKLLDSIVDFLSAFTVMVQPLASRVEDIPLLSAAIVDSRHAAGEGTAERLSRAALDALAVYPWPGNFSELDDAMRHAIKHARQESIGVESLPLAIRSYHVSDNTTKSLPGLSLDDATKRFEMSLILQAVEEAGGNRAAAARKLGISRARLLRKLDSQVDKESGGKES